MKKIQSDEITDLKEILNKTNEIYGEKIGYKVKKDKQIYNLKYNQIFEMVNCLGTSLISLFNLQNERIGIISENRFEWEIAYLSIVCGTGVVVPLDKALPENELENLIEISQISCVFCSKKYVEILKKIKEKKIGKIQYIICFDQIQNQSDIYTFDQIIKQGKNLIQKGEERFLNAKIDSDKMSIMLFTSGTTSKSKVVGLSHKNICSNLMAIGEILPVDSTDTIMCVLPLHHVFECTVGFLLSMYMGCTRVFSDGIRSIVDNMEEYKVSIMSCVPALYEQILKIADKKMKENKSLTLKKCLGNNIKLLISGAAALDESIENKFKQNGINIVQGYGLTETSPVIAIGTFDKYKTGTVGKVLQNLQIKIKNPNEDGIGELLVKGPSVMTGYFNNLQANTDSFEDGFFKTGDLAKLDDEGYLKICGRKKSVIVLKNGKNIYPEEIENLVNRIKGVKESFVFGKQKTKDNVNIEDVKINVKIVYDSEIIKEENALNVMKEKIKELNSLIPKYKAIRGVQVTTKPLIKTTTNKIKRQENLNEINKFAN